MIGTDIFSEEEYLVKISDKDASDAFSTLMYTDSPRITALSWRPYLTLAAARSYIRKFGKKNYLRHVVNSSFFKVIEEGSERKQKQDSGYFNYPKEKVDVSGTTDSTNEIKKKMIIEKGQLPSFFEVIRQRQYRALFVIYPEIFYHFRHFLPFVYLVYAIKVKGFRYAQELFNEYFKSIVKKIFRYLWVSRPLKEKSLRKIVKDDLVDIPSDIDAMKPLRQGR